ncbi:hypothetical protein, partial [Rheinheimera texasensis]|uniref:hypothetical protein n=1 Tax=Rheinheimera texasensis TaxID=306205 RepID=UPI0032B2A724
ACDFKAFTPTSLRGGHFSQFLIRVKRLFIDYFFTFQTHPAFRVSLHPVGMARIIGRHETYASLNLRKVALLRSFADFIHKSLITSAEQGCFNRSSPDINQKSYFAEN